MRITHLDDQPYLGRGQLENMILEQDQGYAFSKGIWRPILAKKPTIEFGTGSRSITFNQGQTSVSIQDATSYNPGTITNAANNLRYGQKIVSGVYTIKSLMPKAYENITLKQKTLRSQDPEIADSFGITPSNPLRSATQKHKNLDPREALERFIAFPAEFDISPTSNVYFEMRERRGKSKIIIRHKAAYNTHQNDSSSGCLYDQTIMIE